MIDLDEMTMILPEEGWAMKKVLETLPEKGRMLELGTGFGHSTSYFSYIKPLWTIYTVDGYGLYGTGRNLFNAQGNKLQEKGIEATITYIKANGYSNVVPIIADTTTLGWELPLNAMFIDADHTYEWVKKDTEHYMNFVVKGGVIMYHDYNDNWGVQEYFDAEMKTRKDWKTWDKKGIAFAQKQ